MGDVTAGFSMSLDGFMADEDDDVDRVFRRYSIGDTAAEVEAGNANVTMSTEGAESIDQAGRAAVVLVSARRTLVSLHQTGTNQHGGLRFLEEFHKEG